MNIPGLRDLFNSFILTFSRQVLGIGFQVALIVLLARFLGPGGNGQFAIALLLPILLTTAISFGVPAANVYYLGRGDVSIFQVLYTNIWIGVTGAGVGVLIGGILIVFFNEQLFPGLPQGILWLANLMLPLSLARTLMGSILQGKQDFHAYNAVVISPIVSTLVIAVPFLWILKLGVGSALISWGCGQTLGIITAIFFLKSHCKREEEQHEGIGYGRRCLKYGFKSYIGSLINIANYRVDIFLVNLLMGPASAGIYVVAVQFSERFWMLSQAVSSVLLPRISELHTNEDARKKLTPLVARLINYASLMIAFILLIAIRSIISLLFGEKYDDTANAFVWLLPGAVVFNCSRLLSNDIAARGRPELNIWIAALALIINIAGNLILIPRYGIIGAAIATSSGYFVATITTIAVYATISKNPWWLPIWVGQEDWLVLRKALQKFRSQH